MIDNNDIRWLAGLLEGEGCFVYDSNRPRIQLAMVDRDIVEHAAIILNAKVLQNGYTKTGKPIWIARVSGEHAIAWMFTLFTLLGKRRQAKITNIATEWRSHVKHARYACSSELWNLLK